MKAVTIRDLAATAKVSTASVSRALNNDAKVSPDLRKLVLATARTLGYSSDNCARGKVIVVIIPAAVTPLLHYGPMLLNALGADIFQRGYRMELVPEHDIAILNERVFCGAISTVFRNELYLKWGELKNIPLVCINDFGRHIDQIYSVCSNEFQGMRMAIDYLAANGHRRIGLLLPSAQKNNWCRLQRHEGFTAAITASGLEGFVETDSENEPIMIDSLLAHRITAMIAPGESSGGRIAHLLAARGIEIPRHLSLITWEVERTSAYYSPPHTTLVQDFAGLSRQALDIITGLDRKTHRQVTDVLLDYRLIERATVAPPSQLS